MGEAVEESSKTIKNKYKITNKCIDGIQIIGVTVEDENNSKVVKMDDLVKLIRAGRIENAHVVLDMTSGEYVPIIDGGIENLPSVNKNQTLDIRIVCRMISKSGRCIGYRARDKSGKTYELNMMKAWEFAANKAIVDVEAKIVGKHKIIRGCNGFKIEDLPTMVSET